MLVTAGCKNPQPGADAGTTADAGAADAGAFDAGTPSDAGTALLPHLTSRLVDTRFYVAQHMRASVEMQVTGEPFAQLLGYNLNNFNRQLSVTDQYMDPTTGQYRTDPLGYALAIESYEYSKQPMNQL